GRGPGAVARLGGEAGVDPLGAQEPRGLRPERVVPHGADKAGGDAGPRGGHGLVRSLPPGARGEGAEDGLAGGGEGRAAEREVPDKAAYDDDAWLHGAVGGVHSMLQMWMTLSMPGFRGPGGPRPPGPRRPHSSARRDRSSKGCPRGPRAL